MDNFGKFNYDGSGEPDIFNSGNKVIDKEQKQNLNDFHGGDHSPTKLIDNLQGSQQQQQQQHQDDFEHVFHDGPFSGSTKISSNVDDILGGKNDDFIEGLESNFDKKVNQTIDFMNAEKGELNKIVQPVMKPTVTSSAIHPSAPPPPPPTQSKASEISSVTALDDGLHDAFETIPNPSTTGYESDYQKEHYSASPVKKIVKEENDEKFISSEDLLGDFKDERMKTPEPMFKPLTTESSNTKQDIDIKDLPKSAVDVLSSSSIKDDILKLSNKIDEKIVSEDKNKSSTKESSINVNHPKEKPASEEQKKITSAEEIFFKFGLDTWFKPECLHPKVESLIYWRDVKKSGIVFGAGLLTLLAISCFSVISVFAYISLLILAGTILFRIYKTVMGAVQKTSEGHPFKEYLELDLNLPHEKVQQIVNVSVAHVNGFVSELRRLFLVEDLVDSIKFGVILWVLTYVGAWFNGMTLVILAFVSLFTLPKVYENNKQSIDTYLNLVRVKILEITDKVKAAIPIGKKPETDKDK